MMLINVLDRVLKLGMIIVLARLLSPTDFGLLGIALLTLEVLKGISALGTETALIQKVDEDVDRYLDTAWIMKAARGVVLFAVAFLVAPYAARFFGEPRATDLVRVLGVTLVLNSVVNPAVLYFRKNLEFEKEFVYSLSSTLVHVVTAVGMAVWLRSVWALVAASIANSLTRIVVSYAIDEYRPRLGFETAYAREMFGYGKWIFGSGILVFLLTQGDDAFLGWFLGASALGIYQVSYRFSKAPSTEIAEVIKKVTFPAYSQIQDDTEKLREGYFRTLQLTTFVSFPMATGIIVTAPTFVRTFLGVEWIAAITVMQVLGMYGLLLSLGSLSTPLFYATGNPDYTTKIQAVELVVVAALIYPATARFGAEGTAAAITAASLLFAVPVGVWLSLKIVDGRVARFVRALVFPLFGSVLMGASVYIVRETFHLEPGILEFVLLVGLGGGVYATVEAVLTYAFDYGIEADFRMIADALQS